MELYRVLTKIHNDIKSRFIFESDEKVWGVREHWESYDEIPEDGPIKGDCDCFALACRRECRKLGIPSRLVFCMTEDGTGHLVLSVDKWIIDNRFDIVVKKEDMEGYLWIKISGYEKGDDWSDIV